MTLIVQITIITLGALLLSVVLLAAIQKKITESHALLWVLPCILIIVGGIFPQLTYILSNLLNTEYPPAIIFAIAIIMLYVILFQCFKSLSILTKKNKELASQIALQNRQIDQLKEQIRQLSLKGEGTEP